MITAIAELADLMIDRKCRPQNAGLNLISDFSAITLVIDWLID